MKKYLIGLIFALACGGGMDVDDQGEAIDLGAAHEAYTAFVSQNEVWGSDGSIAPWTKCTTNGPSTQHCYFLRPATTADPGHFGTPARFKVAVLNSTFPGPFFNTPSVISLVRDATVQMTNELQNPALMQPVLIDYDSNPFSTGVPTPVGINIHPGTIAGNIGARTDNYFTLQFNACLSNALSENVSLVGTYHPCALADVAIDTLKISRDYPDRAQQLKVLNQVIVKAILTGLGAARQENTTSWSNRNINLNLNASTQHLLLNRERDGLACIGSTSWDTGGMMTQDATLAFTDTYCADRVGSP